MGAEDVSGTRRGPRPGRGAVFAMGGGTVGEHEDAYASWESSIPRVDGYFPITTTPVDRMVVDAARRPGPRVLLMTTASEDGRHDVDVLVDALRAQYVSLGAALVEELRLVERVPDAREVARAIERADVVYVTGGNTQLLMDTWRARGVDALLRSAWERGTVMAGSSAGAICWAARGCSNSYYTGRPFEVTGLGWIDLLVCPHYDTEPFRHDAFRQMLRDSSRPGLALDEHAALEVRGDRYRIVAVSDDARAMRCSWVDGAYVTTVLLPADGYQPLSSLTADRPGEHGS